MQRAMLTLLVLIGLSYGSVAIASDYDEGIDGDLSGNRLAPTSVSLDPGTNTITATSVSGDLEYFTVTVPVGFELSALTLASYVSLDALAFIGVQSGTTFTEPATGTDVSQLLGWTHFGSGNSTVGTDILDDIGAGFGAIGFTGALGAGDYTFWSQQTGVNSSTYALELEITAAVAAVPVLSRSVTLLLSAGLGLMLLLVAARRRALAGAARASD
jgi:hypothetical protein